MKPAPIVLIAFAVVPLLSACGGKSSMPVDGATGGSSAGAGVSGGSSSNGGASGGTANGGAANGGTTGTCSQCGSERACCDAHCVNLANDPLNCGRCGQVCADGTYCTAGECVVKPCETTCADATSCCGNECCAAGQLCCDPQGPIAAGAHCAAPTDAGTCPMGCAPLCKCTSPDTPIATPQGDRAMATLRVGELVYSVDDGAVRAVPIARINKISVTHHEVVRVRLATGAVLEISGTHPTADGRRFDQLSVGSALDQVRIVDVKRIPYAYSFTYDILPNSSTGTYFAGGVLIGSTLATPPSAGCAR